MNGEDFLIKRAGKDSPFTVPDNYFSDFAQQMMNNLPEKEGIRKTERTFSILRILRPIVAAACVCGAIFGAGVFFMNNASNDNQTASSNFQYTAESNINQMLEYAMLDNEDFYNYVLEDKL